MSEIVNQLKNQSYNEVNPSAFLQVGGAIFPDNPALFDVHQLTQIVEGYQKTHLIAYGGVIPNTYESFQTTPADGSKTVFIQPDLNEVYQIQGISLSNAGVTDPITCDIYIEDTLIGSITAGAALTTAFGANHIFSLVKGANLYIQITDGTPTDAVINAATVKSSI